MIFGCFFKKKDKKFNVKKDLEDSMALLKQADKILDDIHEASLDGEQFWFDPNNNCSGALNCGNGPRKPRHQE